MKIKHDCGIEIEITTDSDGFPLISIDTINGFLDEKARPTVEVVLNGHMIHDMFNEEDFNWLK